MAIMKFKGDKEELDQLRKSNRGKIVYRQLKNGTVVTARWPKFRSQKKVKKSSAHLV